MAVKNFVFRKNWVGSEVASMKRKKFNDIHIFVFIRKSFIRKSTSKTPKP